MPRRKPQREETFQSVSTDSEVTNYGLNSKSPGTSRSNPNRSNPSRSVRSNEKPRSLTRRSSSPMDSRRRSKRKSNKPLNIRELQQRNYEAEVGALQRCTGSLIPKLPFSRVIKEVLRDLVPDHNMRITFSALEALQGSSELYLTQFFEDAYRCTLHRNRVTLQVKDLHLTRYFRGPNDPGNR